MIKEGFTILTLMSIMILLIPACNVRFQVINGSGNQESREYSYVDFTRIEVGHAFVVEVTKSESFSINITMDDNMFDYLIISKSGDRLTIRLKPNNSYDSYSAIAHITMPDIYEMKLSGAARGTVEAYRFAHDFILELSGASSLNLDDVETGRIDFNISGSSYLTGNIVTSGNAEFEISGTSSATLFGSAYDLDAVLSGASQLILDNFTVYDADLNFSGTSLGTVNLDGTLNAILSGASNLYYIGSPILGDLKITGGSSLKKKYE